MERVAVSAAPGESFDPGVYGILHDREDRHFWFRARRRVIGALLRQIAATREEGFRVLEAGCGNGHLLGLLEDLKGQPFVVGVDLFLEGLLNARGRSSCALVRGDVRDIAFRKPFDLVCLFDVLEHVDDDAAVLGHLRELLRPAGTLFLTVPAHPSLWSAFDEASGHRRRYTRDDLSGKLLRAGFSVDYLTHFLSPLLPLIWAKRKWSDVLVRRTRRDGGGGMHADYSDLAVIPLVNGLLERILAAELPLVCRRRRIPFGSSILVLASRNAHPRS